MGDLADVAAQYAVDSLLPRIEAALAQAGLDAPVLDWRGLTPLDHFHSRGIAATAELAAALAPESSAHVLDVGCGLGGPARFLAGTYGCRVTGLDLTPAAVAAATALSARTGLDEQTHFLVGDALALPFPDMSFGHAWTQHAAMNISDRPRLYAEIHRVLKPEGRLAIHDVVAGEGGPIRFPVPWAATAEVSFLLRPGELHAALEKAGFAIVSWDDKSAVTIADPPAPPAGMPVTPVLSSSVVAGPA